MALARLAEYAGGLAEVWADVDLLGEVVGVRVVNGSAAPVGLALRRPAGTWREWSVAKGVTDEGRLGLVDRPVLVWDARRERWDGLHLVMSWG